MKKRISLILVCMMLVMVFAGGCGSKDEEQAANEAKTENTAFQKAEADLEEALAPLPDKDTGVKLAAIESTLANSFWITIDRKSVV